MKVMNHNLLVCAFLALIILQATKATGEKYFSYDPSYYWGSQQNDWSDCKDGNMQSPINIGAARHSDERLYMNNVTTTGSMYFAEHQVKINWADGSLGFDSTLYHLNESHWHIPSEHTFNNTRYPLELHLVHTLSYGDSQVVVAILYDFGSSDPFISQLESSIVELINNPSHVINVGPIDYPTVSDESPFYYYPGSFTTPPCYQTVAWILDKKVRHVSRRQVDLLSKAMNYTSNARPVQPINSREVLLCQSPNPQVTDISHKTMR